MGNLDTLKVAAFALKGLKANERIYKQELVKAASSKIYELKTGEPFVKRAASSTLGWWLGEDSTANGGKNGEYDTYNAFQKGMNWLGRAFGRDDSTAIYANSSYFSNNPEARDKYLQDAASKNHWFGSKTENLQNLRERADAGKAEWSDRMGRAKAQQDKDYVGASEKYMDTYDKGIRDNMANLQKRQDRLYNNSGLYGGPGGLGYNTGGPADHRPRQYGPYGGGFSGGRGMGYGGRYGGGYGGGYAGRGRGYGSVYSRGGYGAGGYRNGYYGGGGPYGGGYGPYGGGYRAPGPGSYPGHRRTWE